MLKFEGGKNNDQRIKGMSTDSKESLEQRKRRINITIHKPQESVVPTIPRTSLRKILIQKKPGVNPYKE